MAPKPKLTEDLTQRIRAAKRERPEATQVELAAQFGLNRATIALALASGEAGAEAGATRELALELLMASPLNPRRTFEDADLAELAESIAADGLLQNLVVRQPRQTDHFHIRGPSGEAEHAGFYEIIDGERRYRALQLLVTAGRWAAPVPCRVVAPADEAHHLALSLLINLQRVDVPPLEEADGFAKLQALAPEFWTTGVIAARIGRTQRYVQQRLALANKLTDGAKQLLREGTINIEVARELARAEPELQQEILDQADDVTAFSASEVADWIRESAISVDAAIFNVAASGLEVEGVDGDQFFVDRAAFIEKQKAAIAAKRAEMAKEWAFVEVVGYASSYQNPSAAGLQREHHAIDRSKHGAVIWVNPDWSVTTLTGYARAPASAAPAQDDDDMEVEDSSGVAPDRETKPAAAAEIPAPETAGTAKGPPVTKGHIHHAHRRKTLALQRAVADDEVMAMRLACLALLGPQGAVRIRTAGVTGLVGSCKEDDAGTDPAIDKQIAGSLGKIKLPEYHGDSKAELRLWAHLLKLPKDALNNLFSALIASQVQTAADFTADLGDTPLSLAIAEALGIPGDEAKHGLSLIEDDLAGLRKPALLLVADETVTPGINDEIKPAEITAAIVKQRKRLDYVLPTLRFGDTKTLEAAWKDG